MAHKKRKDSMARAALDVAGGGFAFGMTTDIVGRVPHGQAGAAALATGAGMMPAYATVRIGGVVLGELGKVGKKQKRRRRSWL